MLTLKHIAGAARIKALIDAPVPQPVHKRTVLDDKLEALRRAFHDDYGRPMPPEGALKLKEFADKFDCREPSIGAESDGALIVSWQLDRENFAIRFSKKDVVDWAIGGGSHARWGSSLMSDLPAAYLRQISATPPSV